EKEVKREEENGEKKDANEEEEAERMDEKEEREERGKEEERAPLPSSSSLEVKTDEGVQIEENQQEVSAAAPLSVGRNAFSSDYGSARETDYSDTVYSSTLLSSIETTSSED
ncbi:hypothetical protein PMAYCL1PPCAC_07964, partial [Pristionchus mayeri]